MYNVHGSKRMETNKTRPNYVFDCMYVLDTSDQKAMEKQTFDNINDCVRGVRDWSSISSNVLKWVYKAGDSLGMRGVLLVHI